MVTNTKKGAALVSKPIKVPFNDDTVHIYETYVRVAKEIAERNQRERNSKEDSAI